MDSAPKPTLALTPAEKPSAAVMIVRIRDAMPEGANVDKEVDWRVAMARDTSVARIVRVTACGWLKEFGIDLAAFGLPIDVEEPEPSSDEERGATQDKEEKVLGGARKPLPASSHRNAEAEEGSIAGMIAHAAILPELLEVATPESYSYPQFRVIARAIKEIYGRSEIVDAAAIIQELLGTARLDMACGPEFIKTVAAKVIAAEQALAHAEMVRKNADLRAAMVAVEDFRRKASSDRSVGAEATSQLIEVINRLGRQDELPLDFSPLASWPAPPDPAVYHGPIGDIVLAIAPQTEADPISLQAQFLVAFGSIIGRRAHWVVNATRHYCNLYAAIVGPTGQGLKGTSWNIVKQVLGDIDRGWRNECVRGGLVSGEGMIHAIRDQDNNRRIPDIGITDKRCLWFESELTKVIGCMSRDGNSLEENICQFFDSEYLRSASKNEPVRVTKPHVSIVTHTTITGIRSALRDGSRTNGFGNRFLWILSRRARELPFGGDLTDIKMEKPLRKVAEAISISASQSLETRPFEMDAKAKKLYGSVYSSLIRTRAGAAAPLLDRGAPLVRRLSLLYALLDQSETIRVEHLKAALAFWDYSERSVQFIFGDPDEDPCLNAILDALRKAGEKGLSSTQINREVFHGQRSKEAAEAIVKLASAGLIERQKSTGRGRPVTTWYLSSSIPPP